MWAPRQDALLASASCTMSQPFPARLQSINLGQSARLTKYRATPMSSIWRNLWGAVYSRSETMPTPIVTENLQKGSAAPVA